MLSHVCTTQEEGRDVVPIVSTASQLVRATQSRAGGKWSSCASVAAGESYPSAFLMKFAAATG
jgi:hypothetical protein